MTTCHILSLYYFSQLKVSDSPASVSVWGREEDGVRGTLREGAISALEVGGIYREVR